MADFEETAHEYAYQLMVDPPDLMAERLEFAAQEYYAGLSKSETENRQTEMLKWITKPGAGWKLSGWRPGMPGALTTRAAKAVKLLRRGLGRSPKNWAAERFIPAMINVAAVMQIKVKRPYHNDYKGGLQPTDFTQLCDAWLRIIIDQRRQQIAAFAASTVIPPDAEISLDIYRKILKRYRDIISAL